MKIRRQGDLEVSPQSRQEMPSSGPGSGDANREVDRLERLGWVPTVGRRKRQEEPWRSHSFLVYTAGWVVTPFLR